MKILLHDPKYEDGFPPGALSDFVVKALEAYVDRLLLTQFVTGEKNLKATIALNSSDKEYKEYAAREEKNL